MDILHNLQALQSIAQIHASGVSAKLYVDSNGVMSHDQHYSVVRTYNDWMTGRYNRYAVFECIDETIRFVEDLLISLCRYFEKRENLYRDWQSCGSWSAESSVRSNLVHVLRKYVAALSAVEQLGDWMEAHYPGQLGMLRAWASRTKCLQRSFHANLRCFCTIPINPDTSKLSYRGRDLLCVLHGGES